jgi:hypothetical protein
VLGIFLRLFFWVFKLFWGGVDLQPEELFKTGSVGLVKLPKYQSRSCLGTLEILVYLNVGQALRLHPQMD